MAAQIIDGKAVSAKVKEEVRAEIEREGLDVGLAVVIVGDDPASRVYVNNKKKACEVCGIKSYEYALPAETSEEQLMELIDTLNADAKVNGILVQLPLPKHLNEEAVIARYPPQGRGRILRFQCWQDHDRQLRVPALHSGWLHGAYPQHRH